jgi:hypothetical protein
MGFRKMAVPPLHGVNPGHLNELSPVLEHWVGLMRSLAREWTSERDCPWWYNERTSVGFLSVAIWGSGGEAIEEYGTDKKKTLRSRKSEKGYPQKGRGDLMFCVNKMWNKENSFVAEAKQTWPSINSTAKNLKDRVNDRIDKARQDVWRCRRRFSSNRYTRLGLLFICPYKPKREPKTKEVREWIRQISKVAEKSRASLAWSFPLEAQKKIWDKDPQDRKKYFYPGVALLVRPLRATNKAR